MIFGMFGWQGIVNCQVASVLTWPVSVIAVAYPLARKSARSTGLADELRLPANPPTPLKRNFPFQFAGSIASKPAEFGPTPSPEVTTEPFTSQYCGLGAAAATSAACAMVILATPRSLSAGTAQSVAQAGAMPMTLQNSTARISDRVRPLGPLVFPALVFMCPLRIDLQWRTVHLD